MPKRSSKAKLPRDLNQRAKAIVDHLTRDQEAEPAPEASQQEPAELTPRADGKDPAAVSLGRRGGLKGGKLRAAKLTSERRSEIAKKAALARWEKANQSRSSPSTESGA